ncbi:type I restriction enzyme, R subunit [Tangfeifania diversioriginum]|uniref:Type I restriction enzyme endonuclease subunit n=1 Tax=Tangfeifania diversioriginum TaxID=1168035 RepID=A0A1M6JMT8_9BACT|nr:HsdR family type I site-specific deoxyribonuclease [Tangfeifania diversioriginum]SHJ47992.1 type I restriction enzyme, R subunit [Tangfeifania diversioriginum]
MSKLTENTIEDFTIELLQQQGFEYVHAPDIAPDGIHPERQSYEEVLLTERLKGAVRRINPNVPPEAQEEALKELQRVHSPELLVGNEAFHRMLTEGVKVSYQKDGHQRGDLVWLIDFDTPENNDFLVANQYTIIENDVNKRPDVILFVNGLPLVVMELKNAAGDNATMKSAFKQIETYIATIPGLFTYNGFVVISDGLEAKAGTISSGWSRFMAWPVCVQRTGRRSADGDTFRYNKYYVYVLECENDSYYIGQTSDLIKRWGQHISGQGAKWTKIHKPIRIVHYEIFPGREEAVAREKELKTGFGRKWIKREIEAGRNKPFFPNGETEIRANSKSDTATWHHGYISQLETLINGMLNKETLLDLIRHFIVFEKSKKVEFTKSRTGSVGEDLKTGITTISTVKKMAAYHQYYAVNRAVESTLRASNFSFENKTPDNVALESPESYGVPGVKSQPKGDRKGGVVWHTQGSGKSLSMVFFTGKLVLAMDNPTILVITDRNDLDDQLFDTFAASTQLLRQKPKQVQNRGDLKEKLKVASGGVIFTTIQKFQPDVGNVYETLSDRENIVVIADEAHRTQYGFKAKTVDDKDGGGTVIGKKIVYGFAKYMRDALPNATYLGFTGTPIENTDINTPAVFGNYVDVYDIAQAVDDGATVRIYYESRLAKVNLSEEGKKLVEELDDELDGEDLTITQKAKMKWTKLEALIGSENRIKIVAKDIVEHFGMRQEVFEGKGMIVSMSRRIAVDLYNAITELRPDWHSDDLGKGAIKVIMTAASSDGERMAKHHTTKAQRKMLADRMKDPEDELKLVIVRDMWLTGFDAPSMHTMYIDKPMRGHNLMQAIARVNRVYKDKPGGLVVDYLGIASDLKKALSFYSDAGGKGDPTIAQEQAVELMLEKIEVVGGMFHGFPYEDYFEADTSRKLSMILEAEEHILGLEDGRKRFINEVTALSKAFAIAVPHEQAMDVKDEVSFFQAVKARLVKFDATGAGRSDEEIETTIRQVIDQALVSEKVIDVFDAAGIKKPDISILSEEFLLELKDMVHKNVAMEVLKKLLNDEIKARSKKNLVKSKSLMEMLEYSIKRYQNKILTAAEVIDELIDLSKEIVKMDSEAQEMGLSDYEYAFYSAVSNNESARLLMKQDKLRELAVILFERVQKNASIDWTIKESVRAKLKVIIKRTLRQYGYPPDMQKLATETVLKQAEMIARELTEK